MKVKSLCGRELLGRFSPAVAINAPWPFDPAPNMRFKAVAAGVDGLGGDVATKRDVFYRGATRQQVGKITPILGGKSIYIVGELLIYHRSLPYRGLYSS